MSETGQTLAERLLKDAESWAGATHTVSGPRVADLEREAAAELTRLQQANAALVEERNALAHDLALVQTRKHKADIALAEFIEATAGDYDGWILWKIAEARKTALASQ